MGAYLVFHSVMVPSLLDVPRSHPKYSLSSSPPSKVRVEVMGAMVVVVVVVVDGRRESCPCTAV